MATTNVRYIVDDVRVAIGFYSTHLGFTIETDAQPAFAAVTRNDLRAVSCSARWWRRVDGGAPDRGRRRRRVSDHSAVRQPLQPPAFAQLPVVLGAQQRHALDLGPAALRPGHLVVTLGPLRRS